MRYNYDLLDRLILETIVEANGSQRTVAYTYDLFGNRKTRDDNQTGLTTYQYDGNDRLVTEVSNGVVTNYTYDGNGNTLQADSGAQGRIDYVWSAENRLLGVTRRKADGSTQVVAYQYDAYGIRVSQTIDGVETRYLIDQMRPFAEVAVEYDSSLAVQGYQVYGLQRLSRHAGNTAEYIKQSLLAACVL